MIRKIAFAGALIFALCFAALAADPTGTWKASFETQIGTQNYTYEFKVSGEKLTGTAKSDLGSSEITEGKFSGDTLSFVESLKFQDMDLRVEYTGKIAGDEIKFTRKVGDLATEELVAKRVK